MKKTESKRSGYLSQVIEEINILVDEAEGRDELKERLSSYIPDKILQSYKNGIAAGRKRTARE